MGSTNIPKEALDALYLLEQRERALTEDYMQRLANIQQERLNLLTQLNNGEYIVPVIHRSKRNRDLEIHKCIRNGELTGREAAVKYGLTEARISQIVKRVTNENLNK